MTLEIFKFFGGQNSSGSISTLLDTKKKSEIMNENVVYNGEHKFENNTNPSDSEIKLETNVIKDHEIVEINETQFKVGNQSTLSDSEKSSETSKELNDLSDKIREQILSDDDDDEDEFFSIINSDELNHDSDSLCSSQSEYISLNSALVTEEEEPFEWTPYAELHLLNAMRGLRPVGVYYHFYMAMIHDRFTKAMGVNISINELKNKLNTYYNFEEALKISGEDFPCPQIEFSLPPDEFPEVAEIMAKMQNGIASKEESSPSN